MTVKRDDVTKGRKDLDPHGRFRGEWVKEVENNTLLKLLNNLSPVRSGRIQKILKEPRDSMLLVKELQEHLSVQQFSLVIKIFFMILTQF